MAETVTKIEALEILDSRGVPTLQITMASGSFVGTFASPAGKSTGKREAHELRDGDTTRYGGLGVRRCIERLREVFPQLIDHPLDEQSRFDDLLIELDGTENKGRLGANLILALSGAYCALTARAKGEHLWRHLERLSESQAGFPRIYANLINGGKHAPGLDVQEFMVVPHEQLPSLAVRQVADFFHELGTHLASSTNDRRATLVGDEGGYAPAGLNHEGVWSLMRMLDTDHLFDFACDVAASSLSSGKGTYTFEGKQLTRDELLKVYQGWDERFKPLSIEDPFDEDDEAGFKGLSDAKPSFFVVGDDISYTNAHRIAELANGGLIGGVIIKPNQIGTISETLAAIRAAKHAGIHVIVSHRSGETSDTFISDLAYGVGVFGLKIGAPSRGERVAKYNRLLQIEQEVA